MYGGLGSHDAPPPPGLQCWNLVSVKTKTTSHPQWQHDRGIALVLQPCLRWFPPPMDDGVGILHCGEPSCRLAALPCCFRDPERSWCTRHPTSRVPVGIIWKSICISLVLVNFSWLRFYQQACFAVLFDSVLGTLLPEMSSAVSFKFFKIHLLSLAHPLHPFYPTATKPTTKPATLP